MIAEQIEWREHQLSTVCTWLTAADVEQVLQTDEQTDREMKKTHEHRTETCYEVSAEVPQLPVPYVLVVHEYKPFVKASLPFCFSSSDFSGSMYANLSCSFSALSTWSEHDHTQLNITRPPVNCGRTKISLSTNKCLLVV